MSDLGVPPPGRVVQGCKLLSVLRIEISASGHELVDPGAVRVSEHEDEKSDIFRAEMKGHMQNEECVLSSMPSNMWMRA